MKQKSWMSQLSKQHERIRRQHPQDKLLLLFCEAILHEQHALCGVLEVIRWFQIQPNTEVGLITGRPESNRQETLQSLNQLGKAYKVEFNSDLLYMNPSGSQEKVGEVEVAGIRSFQQQGYRVFAHVDKKPDVLAVVANHVANHGILLLYAETPLSADILCESKDAGPQARPEEHKPYDLSDLIPEKKLPRNVQFVWHGINDRANLRQFLASEVPWAEFDVQMNGVGAMLRHDSVDEAPLGEDEELFTLDEVLGRLRDFDKQVKVDLKEGGVLIDEVLDLVDRYGYDGNSLWFNGNIECLEESGIRRLANAHPQAIVQCPIDSLAPLVCQKPHEAKKILDTFVSWGINRFSIDWYTPKMREFFNRMDEWGFEVNIYNVPDLTSFLQAVLLTPRSVTADFNFPQWHYYGRGSGYRGEHYEYTMQVVNVRESS